MSIIGVQKYKILFYKNIPKKVFSLIPEDVKYYGFPFYPVTPFSNALTFSLYISRIGTEEPE